MAYTVSLHGAFVHTEGRLGLRQEPSAALPRAHRACLHSQRIHESNICCSSSRTRGPDRPLVAKAVLDKATPMTTKLEHPIVLDKGIVTGEALRAEIPTASRTAEKLRLVILGSGWGAMSIIKNLSPRDAEMYNISVISPLNHFVYTPLLPSAATGSVEDRSIVEPVRRILKGKADFYEAECLSIDPQKQTLTCVKQFCAVCATKEGAHHSDADHTFQVPYDVLVVAVGASTNTFGVPGAEENCFFMKTMPDAKAARTHIGKCAEHAVLPSTTPEERKRLLSFVVVGGGPSGVEVAAELHDVVAEEFSRLVPEIKDDVSIKLIHTQDHLLSTYDRQVSDYAEQHFQRTGVDLLLHTRVEKVNPKSVVVLRDGKTEEIPFNTCIWCTGVKASPLVEKLRAELPNGSQEKMQGLVVDSHLRVAGSRGTILALGDCAILEQQKALDYAMALFKEEDKESKGMLSPAQVRRVMSQAAQGYPHLREIASRLQKEHFQSLFTGKWLQKNRIIGEEEVGITEEAFHAQLVLLDAQLRGLPATAQVARQQGEYIARLLKEYPMARPAERDEDPTAPLDNAPPFKYFHMGSLAYLGADSAVMDLPFSGPFGVLKGWLIGWAWRGMETFMQISVRNQWLVANDWVRTRVFGRDISNL